MSMAGQDSDPAPGFDAELAGLDPVRRWQEWLARVEAVLFASATPVPRAALARIVGRDVVLDALIGDLRAGLEGRPYRLVAIGDGWHLTTRPAYAAVIRAAADLPSELAGLPELREVDLAVLAAIATSQPVTRAALADLFGRSVGSGIVGRLRAHGVIATGPRSPTQGAPPTLVTTDAFLAMFGLRSLAEMEAEAEMREADGEEDGD